MGRRILVMGSTNAGKTTLARALASKLGLPFVELDALHWGPDWTPVDDDLFRARVDEVLRTSDAWVIDGNYEGKLGDRLWQAADTVVFPDTRLPRLLYRSVRRTVVRAVTKEELYSGNREHLRHLFERDALWRWAIRNYRRKQERFTSRRDDPDYAHVTFVHLRSPREVRDWLASVSASSGR